MTTDQAAEIIKTLRAIQGMIIPIWVIACCFAGWKIGDFITWLMKKD